MRTEAFRRLVLLSVSTLRMQSTNETNWLRGMKYSCRISVSLGSELRRYGTESCIGSLRLTRHASADPIACARVTVQVSIRCSMCFSDSHFISWNNGPCLNRLIVSRRNLVPETSPNGSRLKSDPSTLV